MEQSSGTRIKSLATFIFACGMLGSGCIGMLLAYPQFEGYRSNPILGIIIFLITAAIGTAFSWAATIVLHGFGELVENVADIKNKLESPSEELAYLKLIAASTQASNKVLENTMGKNSSSANLNATSKAPYLRSIPVSSAPAKPAETTQKS